MNDYQLCKLRNEEGSVVELLRRYEKLIHKYANYFYVKSHRSVALEDLEQEYKIIFFNYIYKLDFKRVKNPEKFKLITFMCYAFTSSIRGLKNKYNFEINTINIDFMNTFEEYPVYYGIFDENLVYDKNRNVYNISDLNLFIKDLKNILTSWEYDVIYRVFYLKEEKKKIAKESNLSSNCFTFHFQNILKKIRDKYINEKELLLA